MPVEFASGVLEMGLEAASGPLSKHMNGLVFSGAAGAAAGTLLPEKMSTANASLISAVAGMTVPFLESKPFSAKTLLFSAVTSAALGATFHMMKKSYQQAERDRKQTKDTLSGRGL